MQKDGGYVDYLRQRRDVAVYALDRHHGINVEEFPLLWTCKRANCKRLYFDRKPERCGCGSEAFGQLPFVAFHSCGELRQPWVRGCPQHRAVAMSAPGTSSAAEINFYCPVCQRQLQRGWGFVPCPCGQGNTPDEKNLRFNVHRASPVYSPQTFVLVNAPSAERTRQLNEAGGPPRALGWALRSFDSRRPDDGGWTRDAFVRDLIAKGLPEALVNSMADQAAAAGQFQNEQTFAQFDGEVRERAATEAVTIALAMDQSRTSTVDLATRAGDGWGQRATTYRHSYPTALRTAGLESIELIEKFPVMTAAFGFTRGSSTPGQTHLRAFKRDNRHIVYADLSETEALFVRLRPSAVADWLRSRGHAVAAANDETGARTAILAAGRIPERGEEPAAQTAGVDALVLVHSFAHRLMRRLAVFAGIDRNALSELVVPHHLGFFVYAAARGDFVLGGLQAVFETELHRVLEDFLSGDTRCPLDPGCLRQKAACMACLHVGEPSCRYYNRFLSRSTLFGPSGYLTLVNASSQRGPS